MSGGDGVHGCLEIVPGAVVVDLRAPGAASLTAPQLGEAMEEARAQAAQEDAPAGDLLGDLGLHPL